MSASTMVMNARTRSSRQRETHGHDTAARRRRPDQPRAVQRIDRPDRLEDVQRPEPRNRQEHADAAGGHPENRQPLRRTVAASIAR